MLSLGGDDLHLVAGLEFLVKLNQLVVHVGGDAVVTDLRVDGVGEVERGGVLGQSDGFALRGEHFDLVAEQIIGEGVHKVDGRIIGVEQLVDPFHPFLKSAFRLVF